MTDENKNEESRIKIEDLPEAEQELTDEEAKDVKGGLSAGTYGRGNVAAGDLDNDGRIEKNITGVGAGGGPPIKG